MDASDSTALNGLLGGEADDAAELQAALRWRAALLRLSEALRRSADERPELSAILMEAMHNALEQLLVHGNEDELLALEEWLELEEPAA